MRKILLVVTGFLVLMIGFVAFKNRQSVLDQHTLVRTDVETFVASGNIA